MTDPSEFAIASPALLKGPDPHGEASLLLVESLIHSLVARNMLPIVEAIDVVQIALDAQIELSSERGEDPEKIPETTKPLSAILATLNIDA